MSWGSYFKGAQDFLATASASDVLEQARKAASEVAEAANKVSESVQEEYRKTFVELDCKIVSVREDLKVIEFPSDDTIDRLSARVNQDFGTRVMIFNMSERKYDTSKFDGKVVDVQFRGLPSPPLEMFLEMCITAQNWLAADVGNVVVVHCFEKFSRSAVFLSCFLAFRGQALSPVDALHDVSQALQISDSSVFDIVPSQRRYLAYFQQVQHGIFPTVGRLRLLRAQLNGVPKFESEGNVAFRPYIDIWCAGTLLYSSLADSDSLPYVTYSPSDSCVSFPLPEEAVVSGDVLLRVRHVYADGSKATALRFAFHTGFVLDGFQLAKHELDGACHDSRFSQEAFLDLIFERLPAAGESEDSMELPETLPAVYAKARDVARKLAEQTRKREVVTPRSSAGSCSAEADEFAELEEALRRPPKTSSSSSCAPTAAATAVGAERAAKAAASPPATVAVASSPPPAVAAADPVATTSSESVAAVAASPPTAIVSAVAAVQAPSAATSEAPPAAVVEPAAAARPAAPEQAAVEAAAAVPTASTDMDDLFNDLDAALASFSDTTGSTKEASSFTPPARVAPAAAVPLGSSTEEAAAGSAAASAKVPPKKAADDVFGDVEDFLAELDAT